MKQIGVVVALMLLPACGGSRPAPSPPCSPASHCVNISLAPDHTCAPEISGQPTSGRQFVITNVSTRAVRVSFRRTVHRPGLADEVTDDIVDVKQTPPDFPLGCHKTLAPLEETRDYVQTGACFIDECGLASNSLVSRPRVRRPCSQECDNNSDLCLLVSPVPVGVGGLAATDLQHLAGEFTAGANVIDISKILNDLGTAYSAANVPFACSRDPVKITNSTVENTGDPCRLFFVFSGRPDVSGAALWLPSHVVGRLSVQNSAATVTFVNDPNLAPAIEWYSGSDSIGHELVDAIVIDSAKRSLIVSGQRHYCMLLKWQG
jgi:hypothetical protein